MKKIVSVFLILVFMISTVSSVSASQIEETLDNNVDLLKKYEVEFMEMGKELREIEAKLKYNSKNGLSNENIAEGVLTRNIPEGDSMVTLAIPYTSTPAVEYPVLVTHARLFTKSTWEEDQSGLWGSLIKVEGRVLDSWDGAVCTKIKVLAGQYSNFTPGDRTDEFTVHTDNYTKNYNWPEIGFSHGTHDLGHNATFTFQRGTVTREWRVTCNKVERFWVEL